MFKNPLPRGPRVALALTASVVAGVDLKQSVRELNEMDASTDTVAYQEKTIETVTKAVQVCVLIYAVGYQLLKK